MTKFIISLFSKIPIGFRFLAWVLLGFFSALSFVTVNSVWASHTGNGLWYILGGILAFLVIDIAVYAFTEGSDK